MTGAAVASMALLVGTNACGALTRGGTPAILRRRCRAAASAAETAMPECFLYSSERTWHASGAACLCGIATSKPAGQKRGTDSSDSSDMCIHWKKTCKAGGGPSGERL